MTFVAKGLTLIAILMVMLGGFFFSAQSMIQYRGHDEDSPAKYGLIVATVAFVSAILFSAWWALS